MELGELDLEDSAKQSGGNWKRFESLLGTGEDQPDFAPCGGIDRRDECRHPAWGRAGLLLPSGDFIQLPERREGLVRSVPTTRPPYVELAHWSEPRQRFDRQQLGYAMCELVAGMSACFVGSEIGIPHGEALENHAILFEVLAGPDEGRCQFHFPCVEDGFRDDGVPPRVCS